jgi:hypothetical protein
VTCLLGIEIASGTTRFSYVSTLNSLLQFSHHQKMLPLAYARLFQAYCITKEDEVTSPQHLKNCSKLFSIVECHPQMLVYFVKMAKRYESLTMHDKLVELYLGLARDKRIDDS